MTLLITLLFKSLLVFAIAGTALTALRRASAAARYLICLLTLTSLLALPLFSLTLPGWHLPVLEPIPAQHWLPGGQVLSPLEGGRVGVGAPLTAPSGLAPSALVPALGSTPTSQQIPAPKTSSLPGSGGPLRSNMLRSKEVGSYLFVLYAFGVLLAALRPLLGLWGITRLQRLCTVANETQTLTVATRCAALLRLPMPRLCRADVSVPMTWGWHRPVVLLPSASTDWQEDRLQSVLLHEMAHIKRRDWAGHRLADLVCALYWFHPLVWLTARRLRSESELACDDLVLTAGITAPDYARHLLEIASTLRPASPAPQAAIAMAQTSDIEGRIIMILDKTHARHLNRRAFCTAAAFGSAALIALAVLRPDTKALASPSVPQTQFAGPVSVRLAGITNANRPGSRWWQPNGVLVRHDLYNTASSPSETSISSAHTKNVIFAFRLASTLKNATVQFTPAGSSRSSSAGFWPGKMQGQENQTEAQLNKSSGGARTLTAAFPFSMRTTSIGVGVASGLWTKAASDTNLANGTNTIGAGTPYLFSPAVATRGGSLLTVTTSEMKQDVRFVAFDMRGRQYLPSAISGMSSGAVNQDTLRFDLPVSKLREIRVETRPFLWTNFSNVALQPVK